MSGETAMRTGSNADNFLLPQGGKTCEYLMYLSNGNEKAPHRDRAATLGTRPDRAG
jgi:hypothetical protein